MYVFYIYESFLWQRNMKEKLKSIGTSFTNAIKIEYFLFYISTHFSAYSNAIYLFFLISITIKSTAITINHLHPYNLMPTISFFFLFSFFSFSKIGTTWTRSGATISLSVLVFCSSLYLEISSMI